MGIIEDWFFDIARDDKTRTKLKEIFTVREKVLAENRFYGNTDKFLLRLGNHKVVFDMRSAVSAIETYQEIFLNKGHRNEDGFDGRGARVVMDIGANRGFYSLSIRDVNKSAIIYAYEPNPYEYKFLREHVKLNDMNPIVIRRYAVERVAGTSWMDIVPEIGSIGGKKMLQVERKWMKEEFCKRINVKSVTLNEIIKKNKLKSVDILKIDAEGAETDILSPLTNLSVVKKVVVEYHSVEARNKLIATLCDHGFLFVKEDKDKGRYYGDLYFVK